MTQQCQGGWCRIRNACRHYTAPASADEPADRLCDPAHDGRIDGFPMRQHRAAGSWGRASVPSMLTGATWLDGVAP